MISKEEYQREMIKIMFKSVNTVVGGTLGAGSYSCSCSWSSGIFLFPYYVIPVMTHFLYACIFKSLVLPVLHSLDSLSLTLFCAL